MRSCRYPEIPTKYILSVEKKYGGLRFNAQIGKYPHVEIWSRPDLAYMKNRLSSYIVGNTVPVFIGPKCGAHYLNYNLHCPIMYPCGADIYGTNLLWCTYGNCQFDEHIIRNGLEFFVDAYHDCAVADLWSISCIIFTFIGITVH